MLFGLQESIHVTEILTLPVFKFNFQGHGFVSFVHFGDKTVSSNVPCSTKKQAEQLAAREALLAIGVHDPESAFRNKGSKKSKSKRTFAPRTGFKRTWVHSHGGQGPQLNSWLVVNSKAHTSPFVILFFDSLKALQVSLATQIHDRNWTSNSAS